MRLALIGASGFVGSRVLEEALDRGHFTVATEPEPRSAARPPGASG